MYKAHAVNAESSSEDDFEAYDVGIRSVSTGKAVHEITADVTFKHKAQVTITGKVDTGAEVTCMPVSLIQNLQLTQNDLSRTNKRLRRVSGEDLRAIGEISLTTQANNQTHNATIIVTKFGKELLVGLDFCYRFELVQIAESCTVRNS